MAKQTTNYNLVKPDLTDSPPDITVTNPNWDTIDQKIKETSDKTIANETSIVTKANKDLSNVSDEAFKAKADGAGITPEIKWDDILGKPVSFPPTSHTHSTNDLTDIVPLTKGGTGANNITIARQNLNVYSKIEVDSNLATGLNGKSNASHTHDDRYYTEPEIDSKLATKSDTSTLTNHTNNKSNPHAVTKSQVGLGNVDNTSDANKPISTAVQTALNAKVPTKHNSSTTEYGIGDKQRYGHVMLSDVLDTNADSTKGKAATPSMVYNLNTRINSVVVSGGYFGTGTASRTINLGFTPKAVLVFKDGMWLHTASGYIGSGGLAAYPSNPCSISNSVTMPSGVSRNILVITGEGFSVYYYENHIAGTYSIRTNTLNDIYHYIAFH